MSTEAPSAGVLAWRPWRERTETCAECRGTGIDRRTNGTRTWCARCRGAGRVERDLTSPRGDGGEVRGDEPWDARDALAALQASIRRAEVEAVMMIANTLSDAAAETEMAAIASDLKRLRQRVLAVAMSE